MREGVLTSVFRGCQPSVNLIWDGEGPSRRNLLDKCETANAGIGVDLQNSWAFEQLPEMVLKI